MVFLIQKAQNKDSLAIKLKLNELVASNELSSSRLVDIESISEEEMVVVQKYYYKLSMLTQKEKTLHTSHSLGEAQEQHDKKSSKKSVVPRKKTSKQGTFTHCLSRLIDKAEGLVVSEKLQIQLMPI